MDTNNKNQSIEFNKPTEENLVHDLKESLNNTIDETKHILNALEQSVETIVKDKSISEATKEIVDSISDDIKNFTSEGSEKIYKTIKDTNSINKSEEE